MGTSEKGMTGGGILQPDGTVKSLGSSRVLMQWPGGTEEWIDATKIDRSLHHGAIFVERDDTTRPSHVRVRRAGRRHDQSVRWGSSKHKRAAQAFQLLRAAAEEPNPARAEEMRDRAETCGYELVL